MRRIPRRPKGRRRPRLEKSAPPNASDCYRLAALAAAAAAALANDAKLFCKYMTRRASDGGCPAGPAPSCLDSPMGEKNRRRENCSSRSRRDASLRSSQYRYIYAYEYIYINIYVYTCAKKFLHCGGSSFRRPFVSWSFWFRLVRRSVHSSPSLSVSVDCVPYNRGSDCATFPGGSTAALQMYV